MDVHPNGKILATGSQDHTAVVWDLTTASDFFICTGGSVVEGAFNTISLKCY